MSTFQFCWGIGIFLLAMITYSYIFIKAYKKAKGYTYYRIFLGLLLLAIDLAFIGCMVIMYKVYVGLV
jgi:hypothetical protein